MFLDQLSLFLYFSLLLQSQIIASEKDNRGENVEMEVRAVFMNCGVNENDDNFPQSENTHSSQEELFKHGSLINCKKKLALTIKMSADVDGNSGDEYIPIDHVISGPSNKRTRLLNPYVLRLRRDPPLQAYELRRFDTVRGVLMNTDSQEENSSNFKRQTTVINKEVQKENQANSENEYSDTTRESSNATLIRFKRAEDENEEQNPYNYKSQTWIDGNLVSKISNFQQSLYESGSTEDEIKQDYSHRVKCNTHKIKHGHRFKYLNHRNSDKEAQRSKPLIMFDSKFDKQLNSKYDDKVNDSFTTISSDFENGDSRTEAYSSPSASSIDTTEKAYALYEIGNPDLWSTVNVQLFEKIISPNGQVVWNDITKGKTASVSSSLPDWGNQDMNIRYQNTEWVAREDFVLPTTHLCLLAPLKEFDWANSIDNLRSENDQEYFVLPMDAIINLEESNNIMKRYSSESDFSSSTVTTSNEQFRRRVQIRLSRALFSGINKTMGIASRGNARFLTLPYRRSCRGQIDLEARADENQLVNVGSSGRITTAVSDSTRPTSTALIIQATNNGLVAAQFRAVVRECHPSLLNDNKKSEEFVTNRLMIPPMHTRALQLQVLNEIPVNSFHCSVGLLNDHDVQVAVRDVTIKKGDRCFCVWHCDCVCLSEDPKLLCREMSTSRQIAAGLSPQNRRRHARSVCYNDIVTVDMFVTVIGVISALLFLGLLKAVIGLFIPTVRNWGLDRVLQTPRKLDHYYECSLSSRPVVYDNEGWPVHPDTKQRTVHLVSRSMEFILNLIFFIVTPCLTGRNLLKKIRNRCNCSEKPIAAKKCCTNKETKKCFSSQDMQSVAPRWRRRRGGLRRWMTPQAEELSTDIWQKALLSEQSNKSEFMRPLLHEHRYHDNNSVEGQDSCADSEQEDTEYVLMQMQKSRESLRRTEQKLNDSQGFLARN